MSEIKTVFILVVIGAIMFLLQANYVQWINNNQISSIGISCGDINYDEIDENMVQSVKNSCEGEDIPWWFNLIWVTPLGAALLYAIIPWVK